MRGENSISILSQLGLLRVINGGEQGREKSRSQISATEHSSRDCPGLVPAQPRLKRSYDWVTEDRETKPTP